MSCSHQPEELTLPSPLKLSGIEPVSETSHQHDVYFAWLSTQPVVVKVFDGDRTQNGRREAQQYESFAAASIPVPDVLWSGATTCQVCSDELWVLITAQIDGRSAQDLATDRSLPFNFGEDVIRLMIKQFSLTAPISGEGYLQRRVGKLESKYGYYLRQNLRVPENVFRTLRDASLYLNDPLALSLVTFDWRLRHVFLKTGAICGVIDLEYGKPGDPLLEIANFLHDVRLNAPTYIASIESQVLAVAQDQYAHPQMGQLLNFYGARQALSHAAIRHSMKDAPLAAIDAELALGLSYADSLMRQLPVGDPAQLQGGTR